MKITFIGAGNMAEAIVSGIVKQQVVAASNVCLTDISEERLEYLSQKYGVETSLNNPSAVADADVVVLAVKPQIFPSVWPEIAEAIKPDTLVISVMAGVPSATIAGGKTIRIVRVMPNTPALIGKGAAGIAAGELATEADLQLAEKLMSAVGIAVRVKEEELHAVTAVSGSSPAYVFYLLENMLAAADQMGMEKGIARELALATVIGAAELMKESGEEADALRNKVTSKGGTTAAAINTMIDRGVGESIIAAMKACAARSRELANG